LGLALGGGHGAAFGFGLVELPFGGTHSNSPGIRKL
jgi:hypothetical protein